MCITSNRADRIAQQPVSERATYRLVRTKRFGLAESPIREIMQHATKPGKLSNVRNSRNSSSRNVTGSRPALVRA